jgi:hypothetical protein
LRKQKEQDADKWQLQLHIVYGCPALASDSISGYISPQKQNILIFSGISGESPIVNNKPTIKRKSSERKFEEEACTGVRHSPSETSTRHQTRVPDTVTQHEYLTVCYCHSLLFPFLLENTQACVISLSLRRWKMRPKQDSAKIDLSIVWWEVSRNQTTCCRFRAARRHG